MGGCRAGAACLLSLLLLPCEVLPAEQKGRLGHEARLRDSCGGAAGAQVTAGTLNCEGSLWVEVQQAGQATFLAHLAQAVEAAQGRAAPVQRVADAVAGQAPPALGCVAEVAAA